MPRRRLRLSHSSDEEEEEEEQEREVERRRIELTASTEALTLNSPNPNPHSNPNPNPNINADPNPNPPIAVEISDDDFVDVPENMSPPSPSPSLSPPEPIADQSFQTSPVTLADSGGNSAGSYDCAISEYLRNVGLRLRRDWLDSCISALQISVARFSSLDAASKVKLCFEQFLFSDMNYSGSGVLPENVHSMHLVELEGPFVLKVDEIVNISRPLRDRYQNAPSGNKRCLKLSMTDGVQRVFGMEYKSIKDLDVMAPAGLKVAIQNVNIQRGILMLVPECLEVLGGLVEDLDLARQRLVNEVNKPPRGKRTRTGVVPSLATRATRAAWPLNDDYNHTNRNSSTVQGATPVQASDRDASLGVSGVDTSGRTTEEFASTGAAEPAPSFSASLDIEGIHMVGEVEHPLILTGHKDIPFTYLASLLAKWAANIVETAFVRGKIKCFLTGVKKFQFKQRTKFVLQVYVDDGSLISEILIDHNVVQKALSYSPQEVTAALASSDTKKIDDMKENMKQFQIFLVNFEGTMLVEMNESSSLPVPLEMNQVCSASDAWLLLRRLKFFTSS